MLRFQDALVAYLAIRVLDSLVSKDKGASSSVPARTELDAKRKFEISSAIAEQIWREQQITSFRIGWNLTFQGFLFAAFSAAFAAPIDVPGWLRPLAQLVIAGGGAMVARTTRHSVYASQFQRDYLKRLWTDLYPFPDVESFPRPFAVNSESNRGRLAAGMILTTILWMWLLFAILAVIAVLGQNWLLVLSIARKP